MTKTFDLNADMGEGFGAYDFGSDDELLETVTSANVACGYHAGDPERMRRTVEGCMKRGVAIGAHPGLPDRLGFGRREMAVGAEEAADLVLYQIGALQAFARAAGGALSHVKLHGALYHMAARDGGLARAIAEAIRRFDAGLLVYGPDGSELRAAADERGLTFVAEGFADRRYSNDGRLAPRSEAGAVLENEDEIVGQALLIASEGRAKTLGGGTVVVKAGTICIHGDTRGAAERARRIASHLRENGIILRNPTKVST